MVVEAHKFLRVKICLLYTSIVTQPRTQFVEKFILSQLRIKRDNIFRLFGDMPAAVAGVAR